MANEHFVQFYKTDAELVETVSTYALDVLSYDHQAVLFFGTRRHCDLFRRALLLHDLDVGHALEHGRITFVNVDDVLPRILRGTKVDADAFRSLAKSYLDRARRGGRYRHIHVFGEIVNVLWNSGNHDGTLELERLWNELREGQEFTLYCAFQADGNRNEILSGAMRDVVCTHDSFLDELTPDGIRRRRVFVDVAALARSTRPILPAAEVV